jgi:hypothetical protein
MNQKLNQISQLITSNQRDEAHQALTQYIAEEPEDCWAWYLLSFTTPETHEKIAAAQRAIKLNAGSEKLQTRLAQLEATKPTPKMGKRFRISLIAVVVAIMIIAVASAILFNQGLQPSSRQLPTQLALAEVTNAPTSTQLLETNTDVPSPTVEVVASATLHEAVAEISVVSTATTMASTTSAIKVAAATFAFTPLPQTRDQSLSPAVISTTAPTSDVLTINVTPTIQVTAASEETVLPTVQPTISAPVPSPTTAVVIVADSGVPLNSALNVGIGEMRVISATRPAESYIQEMGGLIPPAPTNQSWVLVEILLVCQNKNTCSASPSNLDIVGSSGSTYAASSQLNISPVLGSSVSNGQIWGYVGFVVPNSESQLRLVVSQGTQNYVFALQ